MRRVAWVESKFGRDLVKMPDSKFQKKGGRMFGKVEDCTMLATPSFLLQASGKWIRSR